MTLNDKIRAHVTDAIRDGTKTDCLTAPLINNLAMVLVLAARTGEPHLQREALIGLVEIARNELDEAVAHYDQVLPH